MQHADKNGAVSPIAPSREFTRLVNRLREISPDTYRLVLAAQVALTNSPNLYFEQALELDSHVDASQLWVTVKGVRLLIRYHADQLFLDHFIVKNHLT